MELTIKQKEGIKIAIERFKNKEKYIVIGGYAGSGKTTTVKFIVDELKDKFNLTEEDFVYCAYTGRAAKVLLEKGNKNVRTLHKLLYDSIPLANGGYKRIPVKKIDSRIVIIDEVSMVPFDMVNLLMTYNVFCIFLGDPGQLSPIEKNTDNHLLDNPHVFLDEVMRQAKESEIIRLTMDIREGKKILPMSGKEVIIANRDSLNTGMLLWADEVICGTNKNRISINRQIRELNGIDPNSPPQDGEKIICLKNDWDIFSNKKEPLINGTIGYLRNSYETFIKLPRFLQEKKIDLIKGEIVVDEDNIFSGISMDKKLFFSEERSLTWKESYKLGRDKILKYLIPKEITYGYAITCWKAQGSQFNKVLVIEENFPFDREEHKKYLYTACTRAADKIVMILNN